MKAYLRSLVVAVTDPGAARKWQRQARFDEGTIDLLEFVARAHRPEVAMHQVGSAHVCLRTRDIDAAYVQLGECGARFTAAPEALNAALSIAYFRDPSGVQYQLLQLDGGPLANLPVPPLAEAIGVLHHVGFTVPDLDDAAAFFEQVVGLETVVRVEATGPEASRVLGLSHVSYGAAVLAVGDRWLELMAFGDPPADDGHAPPTAVQIEFDAPGRGPIVTAGPDGCRVLVRPTKETQ